MEAVTVQPGLCIYCTDRMKTQSLRASGPSRSDFQWLDAVTVQLAELLHLIRLQFGLVCAFSAQTLRKPVPEGIRSGNSVHLVLDGVREWIMILLQAPGAV